MTIRPWTRIFFIGLLFCQIHFSNAAEVVSAKSVGMSSSVLLNATARLQQHIDDGELAGVVAAVARDGKLVYFESLGKLNLDTGKRMQDDALFRIYSMAREVTSAAVLKLYEEGKFQLDDPILSDIRNEIENLDVNSLTPVEALVLLNEIKKKIGS